jgi:hypothetical protein
MSERDENEIPLNENRIVTRNSERVDDFLLLKHVEGVEDEKDRLSMLSGSIKNPPRPSPRISRQTRTSLGRKSLASPFSKKKTTEQEKRKFSYTSPSLTGSHHKRHNERKSPKPIPFDISSAGISSPQRRVTADPADLAAMLRYYI